MSADQKCPQCGTPLPPGALEGLCPACLLEQGATTESGVQGESTAFEALPIAEVARLFPQLEILELIGRGGMGAIYKARQPALDRFVALKILPPQRATGPNFAERFNREARALARLSHPNIVAVHEFGRVDSLHFFLMEYVDGVNLRQLEQAGRLSPRQALEIVPQICDALQYAHDEGVVHRDIKPENVLVDRKGRVKIADFGLARILDDPPAALRLTGEGQVMGTPHYMAPEQVERPLEVDHRADIYALGVVFYEMLTGELPLGKFAPPSRKVEVDVRLDDVVLRALEKEPALRYQQASEVKTGVQQIASSGPALAAPRAPQTPTRAVPFWKLARAAVAACAVFVFVLAITAAVTFALPKTFMSTARVLASRTADPDPFFVQTEFEKIKSKAVITPVVERLQLDRHWGPRAGVGWLDKEEAARLLVQRLELRQSRNTSLIEIRFFSEAPREAMDVANAVAQAYVEKNQGRASIIDRADASLIPIRPNVPLNLALGAVAGIVLGILTFGVLAIMAFARPGKSADLSSQPPAGNARIWQRPAAVVVAVGLIGLAVLWIAWPTGDRRFQRAPAFSRGVQPAPPAPEDEISVNQEPELPQPPQLGAASHNPPAPPAPADPPAQRSRLQVRLVAPDTDTASPAVEFPHPGDPSGQAKIRVLRDVLFGAASVTRAGVDHDPINGQPQIRIRLTEEDAKRFEKLTEENINRQLAILFDNRLLAAPVIRTRIPGGEIAVAGNFTEAEAHGIIAALNNAPLWIVQGTFGPDFEKVLRGRAGFVSLDLDTGNSSTNSVFDFDTRETQRKIREAGLDLVPVPEPGIALLCLDMVLVPVNKGWDDCTPADVSNSWPLMTRAPLTQQLLDATVPYLFRTREDGWGVLQVIGSNDDPPGVKIRFKLVAKADAAGAEKEPVARSIGANACVAHWPEGTLELVALAQHPSTNKVWWRPDGSPFTGAPFENPAHIVWPDEGQVLEFAVAHRGFPSDASTTFDFVPRVHALSQKHWPQQSGKTLPNHELIVAVLPEDARTVTLRAGIAAGPWHTLVRRGARAGTSGVFAHAGQQWTVLFQEPVESDGTTQITATHSTVQGWETRIVAMDAPGKEHLGSKSYESSSDLARTTARFDKLPLAQAQEFRFQIRPYLWAEFRNVSLQPGVRTAVEIAEGIDM